MPAVGERCEPPVAPPASPGVQSVVITQYGAPDAACRTHSLFRPVKISLCRLANYFWSKVDEEQRLRKESAVMISGDSTASHMGSVMVRSAQRNAVLRGKIEPRHTLFESHQARGCWLASNHELSDEL